MPIFAVLTLALATWRIGNMLSDTNQSGPGGLLDKIRIRAGVRFNELSVPYGSNNLSEGLLCIYCNTVWIGLALAVVYVLSPVLAFYVALPFALSAMAVFINIAHTKLS